MRARTAVRRLGWAGVGLLVVAGWLLRTIGEGAFGALFYVVVVIFLLFQIAALIGRFGWLKQQGSVIVNDAIDAKRRRSEEQRGERVAELIRAVQKRDADRIEFLVLQKNVSPFESGRVLKHGVVSNASREAEVFGYQAAVDFFEDWSRNGAAARISRTSS